MLAFPRAAVRILTAVRCHCRSALNYNHSTIFVQWMGCTSIARYPPTTRTTVGMLSLFHFPMVSLRSLSKDCSKLFRNDEISSNTGSLPADHSKNTEATSGKSKQTTFSTDFLDAMLPEATGPNLADGSQPPMRRVRRKGEAVVNSKFERALARIKVSNNNTIVTITALNGDPLVTKTAGMCGFKGARKSTTYAARVVAQQAGEIAVQKGVMTVSVLVKGLGPGRVNALKGLVESKLMIDQVADVTPVPHNGCRPKKARRL